METLTRAMITAAALAGRYRAEARQNPEAGPGWLRMADRWSAITARLAGDLEAALDQRLLASDAADSGG